jgi:hypothetical protein
MEFAVAAGQAASIRSASVVSAHTAEQVISVVTVRAADRPAAVAVALAVVSEALKRPVVTDSSVLAEPDLGSMFDPAADPHLVSSRPREPIEKRWTRTP